jgi:hypothetical protein
VRKEAQTHAQQCVGADRSPAADAFCLGVELAVDDSRNR